MASDEDEADVFVRRDTWIHVVLRYWNRFLKTLPSFTGQIIVIFCVLPISFSIAIFLLTAIFNFGIALIAQTISSLIILLFLVPTLVFCLLTAIATSYILQLTQIVYLRLSTTSPNYSHRSLSSPPPEYIPKLEIEEKLKTC